jgi:hypothetical protein
MVCADQVGDERRGARNERRADEKCSARNSVVGRKETSGRVCGSPHGSRDTPSSVKSRAAGPVGSPGNENSHRFPITRCPARNIFIGFRTTVPVLSPWHLALASRCGLGAGEIFRAVVVGRIEDGFGGQSCTDRSAKIGLTTYGTWRRSTFLSATPCDYGLYGIWPSAKPGKQLGGVSVFQFARII